MILVIKGADFSASNIGKVEITSELTSETLAIMEKLTRFPAEKRNRYAQALNKMIKNLADNDLWDNISMLSIPIMSANIDECSYNVKNGTSAANIDKIYQLNSEGELNWSGYTTGYENKAYYPVNLASNNMVLFGAISVHGETYGQVIGLDATPSWFNAEGGITFMKPQGLGITGNSTAIVSDDRVAVTSAFVANCKGTGVLYIDSKGEYTGQTATSETKNFFSLCPSLSAYNAGSTFSYKIFGCGVGLTNDKAKKLYSIIQEFANNF